MLGCTLLPKNIDYLQQEQDGANDSQTKSKEEEDESLMFRDLYSGLGDGRVLKWPLGCWM